MLTLFADLGFHTIFMSLNQQNWDEREAQFISFTTEVLPAFWQQRQEGTFLGVDNVSIRYVHFCSPDHHQVMVIVTGRAESYLKYQEVIYDLFHRGYDIWMMDHRGQGFSDRLLPDREKGHVVNFSDYVDDLATFWREIVVQKKRGYLLAHSMGAAITTLFLARQPKGVNAAALLSAMFGIVLPMPFWMAKRVLAWAERRPETALRYAIGRGRWRKIPFIFNQLSHSKVRYHYTETLYENTPNLRMGGPTYHWVHEGLSACNAITSAAASITTPLIVLQASRDRVVNMSGQQAFCLAMEHAGHPCYGNSPFVVEGAHHEILFERDRQRVTALATIIDFFSTQ